MGLGTRGRGQFPSGANAAAQGSAWKYKEDLTTALRLSSLLFVPPLALHPSPALLSTPSFPFSPLVF